jgi:truncated hemoglobin YjbI
MLTHCLLKFNLSEPCRSFVRHFANQLAGDALLGRAFPGKHPLSADGEYAWWEEALAGRHYTGRPLHREAAPPFSAQQIGRWCNLLEGSLDQAFSDSVAAEAKGHVLNLATMLAHWQLTHRGMGKKAVRQPETLAVAW